MKVSLVVRRFAILIALFIIGTAVLAAASSIGRGIEPRLVVSPQGFAGDTMFYSVTDMARKLTVSHVMNGPGIIDAMWVSEPPLLLQRVRDFRAASYTLSELDPLAGTLSPVVLITTGGNVPLFALNFVLRRSAEGIQAAIYLPNGEIWVSDAGNPTARWLATVDRNLQYPLQWSPDGTMLSVKDNSFPAMRLVSVADGLVRPVDAPRYSWPVWSPDSRYILLSMQESISENAPIRVVDVAAGGIAPLTERLTGRVARWCGDGMFLYVHHPLEGYSEVRLTDVAHNRTDVMMDSDALLGHVVLSTALVPGHGCDWLIVNARHSAERGERLYLLNRATGEATLLGFDAQVMDVTGDTLTYDAMVAGVQTRQTFALLTP